MGWLIGISEKEWAKADIIPSEGHSVFNDVFLYPWRDGMRLASVCSSPICLSRMHELLKSAHNCYNFVLITSGQYKLEQDGREVFLKTGDIALYDLTRPHRITMPTEISKILISVPRSLIQNKVSNINDLTATRFPTSCGIGAITYSVIQSMVNQLDTLNQDQYMELGNHILDLLTMSCHSFNDRHESLTRHGSLVLLRIKFYINNNLYNNKLDAKKIAEGVGMTVRYINNLFNKENTSLMHYVTQQRLELSQRLLVSCIYEKDSITQIAMQCGFNNMAHFSRVFKEAYGLSPRTYRQLKLN